MAIDDELGLGPSLHNLFRRIRELLGHAAGDGSREERPLDPMVVDRAAWRAMRRNARTWPSYKEAPNRFEILVSQADWDDYWGVDPERKAESVTSYLLHQAADRGLWIGGTPQVSFAASDEVTRGSVRIEASFAESTDKAHPVTAADELKVEGGLQPAQAYLEDKPDGTPDLSAMAASAREVEPGAHVPADETVVVRRAHPAAGQDQDPWAPRVRRSRGLLKGRQRERDEERESEELQDVPESVREQLTGANPDETIVLDRPNMSLDDTQAVPHPVRPEMASAPVPEVAYLLGDGGFRMLVHPGDVIGAVQGELEMPDDVNVRLDGRGFPGVEPRQLALNLEDGAWTLTDYPESGTTIDRIDGGSETVRAGETVKLHDGDVIYLGPTRPLRFHLGE